MKAPTLFISHGSPMELITNNIYHSDLQAYADSINKPDNIIILSAHWETYYPIQITDFDKNPIIHDFYGFPDELYKIKYETQGNSILSAKVNKLLNDSNIKAELNYRRGIDHGSWIPLSIMFPNADIPVIQISIPKPRTPTELKKIGEILSVLRSENTMLIGSGGITHNLSLAMGNMNINTSKIDDWAKEFDDWIFENIESDINNIYNAMSKAPNFNLSHPTTEHFDPIYFTLGASDETESFRQIHEGIKFANLSMRCFATE